MIVAAALCPPAPLLIPGLAVDLAGELRDLVTASHAAVAALSGVDRVVVLSSDKDPGRGSTYPRRLAPGTRVSAAAFSRSDHPVVPAVRLARGAALTSAPRPSTGHASTARDGAPAHADATDVRPGAGTIVAAHLLHQAGISAPTWAVQLPHAESSVVDLADLDGDGTVGLVVMANGSAAHSEHAPGGDDPRSPEFDENLVTAVSSGDPALLSATCRRLGGLAADLHEETLHVLAALGALTADNGRASAELLHYSAPLGIGYLVATWRWAGT